MTKDRQSLIEDRDKRMKEALRVNLQRRKQKARALKSDESGSANPKTEKFPSDKE